MCLLIKEGSRYSYIHRTFQEYLTAYFLAHRRFEGWDKVVHQIVLEKSHDNVIPMLRDMNKIRFEEEYLLAKLEDFSKQAIVVKANESPSRLCSLIYQGLGIERQSRAFTYYMIGDGSINSQYHFLLSIVPSQEKDEDYRNFDLEPFIKSASHLNFEGDNEIVNIDLGTLSDDQVKLTPLFLRASNLLAECERSIVQIKKGIASRNRLVAASILDKLGKFSDNLQFDDEDLDDDD